MPGISAPDPDGKIAWFVLALFAAFYWFDWLLAISDPWPVSASSHYKVYAGALFVVLPLSLATLAALRWLRRAYLDGNENFLPALISVNTVFWAWLWYRPESALLSLDLLDSVRWILPLLTLLAAGAALSSGRLRSGFWTRIQSLSLLALPLVALLLLWHFKANAPVDKAELFWLAKAAVLASVVVALGPKRTGRPLDRWDWAVAAVIVLLTVYAQWQTINTYHQNFYLGPAREVLNGRSLLVNVNCQYGIGVIYFLAAVFKVLGMKPHFTPFTFLLMVWTAIEYLILYALSRRCFRSRLLALAAMATIICFCRFGYYVEDNVIFPSAGPLRFGLPVLVLAAGYLRRSRQSARWAWIEYGLLGVSSIWSLETFVYCLSAWGFSSGAELLGQSSGFLDFVKRYRSQALRVAVAVVAAVVSLDLLTLLRSGQMPQWANYLYYITLYSGSFPNLEMNIWAPWILFPGVVCVGLLASSLALYDRKDLDPAFYTMVGVAGAAASEFSYFIMRSHPNNLAHIAPLFIVLFFYWLDRAVTRREWSGTLLWTGLPVAFFVLAGLFLTYWSLFPQRYDQTMMAWVVQETEAWWDRSPAPPFPQPLTQIWNPQPYGGPGVDASLRLIKTYAADQKEVAVFTPQMEEVLALSGKGNPYEIGSAIQDSIGPSYADDQSPLKAGDVVLLEQDGAGGYMGQPNMDPEYGVLTRVLDKVRSQFKLVPLEHDSTGGIWAVRLAPLDFSVPASKT